jgi:hypothetical protein
MRQFLMYGSVRGASGNRRPYRDRFATVARRRTGRERFLGEGEALYGCLGAGMTTFGTGRRREEWQADPHGGRGKVPSRSPVV